MHTMSENTRKNDAEHCPFILHQLHLQDFSLLESGRLREYALNLGSKRLAEAVALADVKRARNASSTSLAMTVTGEEAIAVDAVLGLAKLAKARR